ncbi:MAG: glycosyltransferase family A protein [Candidatus Sericytochromatia bacterium]
MSKNKLISVILPVYNTEKYLHESIESILNQTYKNIELICVNDVSTDDSLKILESYGKKLLIINNEKNLGTGGARNIGIRVAKGELLAFMDADDIWIKNKLELQLNHLEKNKELDICFSYMKCFLSPELNNEIKNKRFCPPDPMEGYVSVTALVKTGSFKKVGEFNPSLRLGDFIDWFNRAKELGIKFDMLNDILLLRRIHDTNTGVTNRDSRGDYLRLVKEALQRKKINSKCP